MAGAAVVGDNVHYHLEAAGMAGVHKGFVPGIVPKAGINVVVVRYCVSAKVPDVIQVIDHSLDIASVAGVGILPVHLIQHKRNLPGMAGAVIVGAFRGLPLGKAVRHDEIYHIGRSEALTGCTAALTLPDEVRIFETFPLLCEHYVVGAGFCFRGNLNVHKQEIGVIGLMHGLNLETGACHRYVTGRYSRPLHHKLETGVHTSPPTQGLYARYFRGTGLRD